MDVGRASDVREQQQCAAIVGGGVARGDHIGRQAGQGTELADLEALTDRDAGRGL